MEEVHAPLKPPVVHISRPNSATTSSQSAISSAPARPVITAASRPGRPASCSPVARRRELVPRQGVNQGHEADSSAAQTVTARPASALGEQNGQVQGSRSESESSSMFEATVARKEAEAAVQQLARRIAHHRNQEERVLREVWSAKKAFEVSLAASELDTNPEDERAPTISPCSRPEQANTSSTHDLRAQTTIPPVHPGRERVRARDNLQFLSRQKRILQKHKQEAARQQKEKMQASLARQRTRLEAETELRRAQKERIRAEERQLVADREAKQRRAVELQETRRNDRLSAEREREQHARALLQDMLDEERNLSLRLEALRLHQSQLAPFVASPPLRR